MATSAQQRLSDFKSVLTPHHKSHPRSPYVSIYPHNKYGQLPISQRSKINSGQEVTASEKTQPLRAKGSKQCIVCKQIADSTHAQHCFDADGNITTTVQKSTDQVSVSHSSSSTGNIADQTAAATDKRFPDDEHFNALISTIEDAIAADVQPQLITEGSSGSYFTRDCDARIVGVFKPKTEEPFAKLNPKWPKAVQRVMSPCCFGRKCLLRNHGYLSEVGASLIDEWLSLDIVPKTRIIWLASPSFNYGRNVSARKPKVGSLQTFVNNFDHAGTIMRRIADGSIELTEEERQHFIVQFQKMVVLDYIIRNTDRSDANWLIRYNKPAEKEKPPRVDVGDAPPMSPADDRTQGDTAEEQSARIEAPSPKDTIQIAAIDNGLAFPVRHPTQESYWRQFPFYWSRLTYAKVPFDETLSAHLLKHFDDALFITSMCDALISLFRYDADFTRKQAHAQMNVVRGQIANLRESLRAKECPIDLARREPLIAVKKKDHKIKETRGVGDFCDAHRHVALGADRSKKSSQMSKSERAPVDATVVVRAPESSPAGPAGRTYYEQRPVTAIGPCACCCTIM